MDRYAAAGIGGITVWRQALEGRNLARVGDDLRARNLEIVSLCRGGFFPNKTPEGRAEAIEENRRAIREAAELGAPLVVLVCGGRARSAARGIAPADRRRHRRGPAPRRGTQCPPRDRAAPSDVCRRPQRDQHDGLGQRVCDELDHPLVGLAVDAYHVWWIPTSRPDRPDGEKNRLFAFHICDWLTPTTDLLNDRGLMGEGCIDLKGCAPWSRPPASRPPRSRNLLQPLVVRRPGRVPRPYPEGLRGTLLNPFTGHQPRKLPTFYFLPFTFDSPT